MKKIVKPLFLFCTLFFTACSLNPYPVSYKVGDFKIEQTKDTAYKIRVESINVTEIPQKGLKLTVKVKNLSHFGGSYCLRVHFYYMERIPGIFPSYREWKFSFKIPVKFKKGEKEKTIEQISFENLKGWGYVEYGWVYVGDILDCYY